MEFFYAIETQQGCSLARREEISFGLDALVEVYKAVHTTMGRKGERERIIVSATKCAKAIDTQYVELTSSFKRAKERAMQYEGEEREDMPARDIHSGGLVLALDVPEEQILAAKRVYAGNELLIYLRSVPLVWLREVYLSPTVVGNDFRDLVEQEFKKYVSPPLLLLSEREE